MPACFLFPFQNKCDQNVGMWWCRLFLVHLTTLFRMVTKFHNSDIVSLASPRGILELPSTVFSVCQNLYQKLVLCWHVYDRCTNCKFINWYPDMTIWMLVQCTAFWIWIIIIYVIVVSAGDTLRWGVTGDLMSSCFAGHSWCKCDLIPLFIGAGSAQRHLWVAVLALLVFQPLSVPNTMVHN